MSTPFYATELHSFFQTFEDGKVPLKVKVESKTSDELPTFDDTLLKTRLRSVEQLEITINEWTSLSIDTSRADFPEVLTEHS